MSTIIKLLNRVHALQDVAARHTALEIMLAMLDVQCEILERAIGILPKASREQLVCDPVIQSVLLWHGLHPLDPVATNAAAALDGVELDVEVGRNCAVN